MRTDLAGGEQESVQSDDYRSGHDGDERRRSPRYDIRAVVTLTYTRNQHPCTLSASTKDVSIRGAFVVSDTTIPAGTPIGLELHLEIDGLPRLIGTDRRVQIVTDGTVVRNEHHGFATSFSRNISFRAANRVR